MMGFLQKLSDGFPKEGEPLNLAVMIWHLGWAIISIIGLIIVLFLPVSDSADGLDLWRYSGD